MREKIKSIISFSLAVPLLGIKQVTNLFSGSDADKETAAAVDALTHETEKHLGSRMQGLYKGGDTIQRSVLDLIFSSISQPSEEENSTGETDSTTGPVSLEVDHGKLDTSKFIVMGEGLAAGMGDFGLSEEFQTWSFPAQMAQQMQTEFNQPYMQSPGIGDVIGLNKLPVRVPDVYQDTVRSDFPPTVALHNLSIPGLKLADAVNLKPSEPIVHRNDALQTMVNLILGLPDLLHEGDQPLMTQLEYALSWKPTFTIVSLGYQEVMEAMVSRDGEALPDISEFRDNYARIISSLKQTGSEVLITTIPDPADTAYFSPIDSAARVLKLKSSALQKAYRLAPDDRITVQGLMEMGCQLIAGNLKSMDGAHIVDSGWLNQVSTHVAEMNNELASLASEHGALVYDLGGFYKRVRDVGISIGSRRLSADFLGGFYELNGYFPGPTGQGLIANDILQHINRHYDAGFSPVDIGLVMANDPVADYRIADGPDLAEEDLSRLIKTNSGGVPHEVGETYNKDANPPPSPVDQDSQDVVHLEQHMPALPLTLPSSMEQVLSLNKEASYYGDAIRAVNCRNSDEAIWGSGREQLFGGLAIVDSHLEGNIRIRFSESMDQISHFEVTHEKGLFGDDGMMTAPQFFKLPACHNSVKDDPDLISSGDLNLATGEVTNMEMHFRFMNTALLSLVRCNPKFPDVPISFPGKYGSAHATFENRPDGNLDISFFGTTFVPLGMVLPEVVRFPLPFASPTLDFASIPASGAQLHPHIFLSTRPPEPLPEGITAADIPTNTIQEFTANSRHTSFGDKFGLNMEELGGEATGRSQLTGRVEIQFGERFGDSVSIAVCCHAPGGMLYAPNPPPSTLSEAFPGRLYSGLHGHNEFLRFPKQTYALTTVYCLDDPMDVAVGAVNLKTGRLLADFMRRGMVGQDLFMALLEVEPRTPQESFQFRGPAWFEKDERGQSIFRYKGLVTILYPEGFLFPAPDLKSGFASGPGSILDPFYWIQAMHQGEEKDFVKKGSKENVEASTGDMFSMKYEVSNKPGQKAMFEYTNHTQEGTFTMHKLSWVDFSNSMTSTAKEGSYDTVTFTGFGTWSKDDTPISRTGSVQISTNRQAPYITIQIDGGFLSNVNTKPQDIEEVRP